MPRESVGKGQVLRSVLDKELKVACEAEPGWSFRRLGAGRTVWISDPKRAPRSMTGGWGAGTWLWLAALAVAAALGLGHAVGLW